MGDERNPPFNMAVATLMRLDAILKEIKNLHYRFPVNCAEKQHSHINLIKEFFMNSIPLLGNDAEDFKEEILNFSMKKRLIVVGGNQRYIEVYDERKDKRLNDLMFEINIKLKSFFMPGKKKSEGLI